jgi:hypothetical protein
MSVNCGFCGRFVDSTWREQWGCFAHETTTFCRRCFEYAPTDDYEDRMTWGRQAGLMTADEASRHVEFRAERTR